MKRARTIEDEEGEEGQVGIIEKINLENFMCHANLEMKFGPNVNFLVGLNGSGKSAILVALTICLGSRVSFTNRGSKITDLIRKGASYATVSVKLRNRGSDAFKPEEYGESIVVERRLTKDGQGSYKLKDATGRRTISTKKSELVVILEQFNIQINNPCVILMQDTSREFLNSSKATDKYQFFLMATQLDQMHNDFDFIDNQLEIMKQLLSNKEKMLPDLEKQLKTFEREYREMDQLRNFEEDIKRLNKTLIWAHVRDGEDLIQNSKEHLKRLEGVKEKIDSKLKEADSEFQNSEKDRIERTSIMNDLNNKIIESDVEKRNLEKTINELKKDLRAHQAKGKDAGQRMHQTKKRLDNLRSHMQQIRDRAFSISKEENERSERQIAELEEKSKELEAELMTMNQKLESKRNEMDEASKRVEKISRQLREKEEEYNDLDKKVRTYEQQKANRVRVFGHKMPQMLESIKQHLHRFHRPPIGPIGMCMNLNDARWALATETILRNLLDTFVVDNHQDEKVLRDLAIRLDFKEIAVVVQTFLDRVYSIPDRDQPDPAFVTILRNIRADHAMVYNVLIDQRKIEGVVLTEILDDAKFIIFKPGPQNSGVGEVVLKDGARLTKRNNSENFIAPPHQTNTKIGVDFDQVIKECQVKMEETKELCARVQRERMSMENKRNDLRVDNGKLQRQILDKKTMLTQMVQEKEHLKKNTNKIDETHDLAEMEASAENYDLEIKDLQAEQNKIEIVIDELLKRLQPYESNMQTILKQVAGLTEKSEQIREDLNNYAGRLQSITTKLEQFKKKVAQTEQEIKRASAELAKHTAEYESKVERAKATCPERINSNLKTSEIDSQMAALQHRLREEQKGKKSLAEITTQYKEAKKRYEEAKKLINKLQSYRERITEDLNERVLRWQDFRRSIAKRTRILFNVFLSQKGCAGSINFNHKDKELVITVQLEALKGSDNQNSVRDTRSLSGGERSFSTVALLLALWEAMECPFRALDEFDVFMDAVSRKLSIEMLLNSASSHRRRQFIFVTPQENTSSIVSSRFVKVIQMYPPDRLQGTLSQGN
eukprot:TRINITY_DN7816_c0_g1_i1.p1 TRINITY_DN7816_c0_g1~~TRINITY_DN7816_c0_g1_i1.p1  ORF type:complete len:1068 (+),score=278.16 TRINITY_DN7816_c0_g1_i1:24-3206(+)